jgi:hypothetical protein
VQVLLVQAQVLLVQAQVLRLVLLLCYCAYE